MPCKLTYSPASETNRRPLWALIHSREKLRSIAMEILAALPASTAPCGNLFGAYTSRSGKVLKPRPLSLVDTLYNYTPTEEVPQATGGAFRQLLCANHLTVPLWQYQFIFLACLYSSAAARDSIRTLCSKNVYHCWMNSFCNRFEAKLFGVAASPGVAGSSAFTASEIVATELIGLWKAYCMQRCV